MNSNGPTGWRRCTESSDYMGKVSDLKDFLKQRLDGDPDYRKNLSPTTHYAGNGDAVPSIKHRTVSSVKAWRAGTLFLKFKLSGIS